MTDSFELTVNDTSANPFYFLRNIFGYRGDNVSKENVEGFEQIGEASTNPRKLEKKLVTIQIFNLLVADLDQYENQYEMDSETFYQAFQSGEIDEEYEDFYDWRAKFSAYRHMNRRFELTR